MSVRQCEGISKLLGENEMPTSARGNVFGLIYVP